MKVNLHVCPHKRPMTFAEFKATHPPRSVAIDGYVDDAPAFDSTGPWANFDHHVGVNRLATRATSAQVVMAIRMHMFDAYLNEQGEREMHVWVNDCDPDVSLSVWCLRNMADVVHTVNPPLNRIVQMCDYLDTTGGTYPFPRDLDLESYDWCFGPYFRARLNGVVDRKEATEYEAIIEECGMCIRTHLMGKGGRIKAEMGYTVLHQGQGWCIAREDGYRARMAMVADGHTAWLLARARPDGRWTYTVQRLSEGVPFDVQAVCDRANEVEGEGVHWGCGPLIGGSDRSRGSRLSPTEMVSVVGAVN